MASIKENQLGKAAKRDYQMALNVLEGKKYKKNLDYYRMASLSKKLGDISRATQWFNIVLETEIDKKIRGAVFFHLAEIQIGFKQISQALLFLNQCLRLIPDHQKARQYLELYKPKNI
jgi:tetratricopeptide (TPR) repeat protein